MSVGNELKSPAFIIGTIIGLLGLISGLYFYTKSEKERVLAYDTPSLPAIIYDSKQASESIRVLDRDSTLIEHDVYVVTTTIWNAGELEIDKEHLREPVSIIIPGCRRILQFRVDCGSDSSLIQPTCVLGDSTIMLSWTHLDPSMTVNVQTIYEGFKQDKPSIAARMAPPSRLEQGTVEKKTQWWHILLMLIVPAIWVPGTIQLSKEIASVSKLRAPEAGQRRRVIPSIVFLTITVAAFGLWFYFAVLPKIYDVLTPVLPG